jgi:hypothetical protein
MINVSKSGATLAAAAFSIALAGTVMAPAANAAMMKHDVKCLGVNSCKGHGSCKQGNHGCKGMNACKGQGWVSLSAKKCASMHGKVIK